MADEEAPKKDGKEDGAAEASEKPKGKFPLKLIILVVGVLVLGGGGFFAWRHFSTPDKETAAKEAEAKATEAEAQHGTYRLEQFVVNLVDPLGRRYLKVQIELELDKLEAVEEARKHDAQIRDSVITVLTAKTYSDIDTPEGKALLRQEILARVNQHLRECKAVNAYFTDFVIQ